MTRLPFVALLLAGLVSAPGLANADGFGRGGTSSKSSGSQSGSHSSGPVRGSHRAEGNGPSRSGDYRHGGGRVVRGGYVGVRPWWGWGVHPWGYYGWGYYPYYGAPVVVAESAPPPPQFNLSLLAGVFANTQGGGPEFNAAIEGRRFGFVFDAVNLPSADPGDAENVTPMPLLKLNLSYAVISNMHARVRVEGGVESASAPGVTYVGPDVGVSGQLALVGPFALQGSARWMPLVPVNIVDLNAGVALNFGALSIQGGWRWIRLDDSNQCDADENADGECGTDLFSGPQVSVGIVL